MAFAGINYLAVVIAAIASWLAGAAWYTVLAKPWTAAIGSLFWCSVAQSSAPWGYSRHREVRREGRETSMRTSVVSLIAAAAVVGIAAIGIRPVLTAPNPNPDVRPADAEPQPFNPQMS